MSERATAHTIPMQATAPRDAGMDIAVRPKVLRRPAHFTAPSSIAAPVPTLVPVLTHPAAQAKPEHTTQHAWQDDGRFAAALLAIVIIVNLVVSAWLSAISPAVPTAVIMKQSAADAPLVAAPVHADAAAPESMSTAISEQ